MKPALVVCVWMWLLAGWAVSHRAGRGTAGDQRRQWMRAIFKTCIKDQEYLKELKPALPASSSTAFRYVRRKAVEIPSNYVYQEYKYDVYCTMLIESSDMLRAPEICEEDMEGCHNVAKRKLTISQKSNHGRKTEVRIVFDKNKDFSRNCHCSIVQSGEYHHTRKGRVKVGMELFIKPTPYWGQYIKDSTLERDDQFNLIAPREDALTMSLNLKDVSVRPVIDPPTKSRLEEYPENCNLRRTLTPNDLLAQDKDLIYFSLELAVKQRLCPSTLIRTLALKISPRSSCQVDASLSVRGRSRPCPSLGYVYFALPFPWNSHLVRDLGDVRKGGKLQDVAFHLPLPLHVTQHMVPGQQYDVEARALDPGFIIDGSGGFDGLAVGKQSVKMDYPDISDGCTFEIDLLPKNMPKDRSKSCPPQIDLATKASPFAENRVDFRARAYVFCVTLLFRRLNDKRRISVTLAENFVIIKKQNKDEKTIVRVVKTNPFQFVPYSVEFKDISSTYQAVTFSQAGLQLFSTKISLSRGGKMEAVWFGVPGYCSSPDDDLAPDCPAAEGAFNTANSAYHTTRIQLRLPNCGKGRCVHLTTAGPFRKPARMYQNDATEWMVNLKPHWYWAHTIGIYRADAEITFTESAKYPLPSELRLPPGKEVDPHGVEIWFTANEVRASMSGLNIPVAMSKEYKSTKIEALLERKSRQIYADHTGVGSSHAYSKLIATVLYATWDMFTMELGLADLSSPYKRAQEPGGEKGGINLENLDSWNSAVTPLASVALPRASLLRYVTEKPCVLEDINIPRTQTPRWDGSPPACIFMGTMLDNRQTKRCSAARPHHPVQCRSGLFDRKRRRSAHPSCLYDPNCPLSKLLDGKTSDDEIMSSKLDFALQSPTTINLPFSDQMKALHHDPSTQVLKIQFMPTVIAIQRVYDSYKTLFTYTTVPMKKGYLQRDTFHGFRFHVKVRGTKTSVHLYDLEEMRPDTTGEELWSHHFSNERLLPSHVFFYAHVTDEKRDFEKANVLFNCVPEYDVCAGPNPCFNGGTCKKNKCICKPGYAGEKCETTACESEHVECLHGGKCVPIDVTPYWACKCDTKKWTGRHCETMFDYCFSKPCRNGATCQPQVGSWTCKCPRRFAGRFCHVATDACSRLKPCKNGATCQMDDSDSDDDFTCLCHHRFTGTLCEVSLAYKVVLFHTLTGMTLSGFPMKLAAQSQGSQPFRCFLDLKDNNFIDISTVDFKQSQMNRKRLWRKQKFDVSQYHYRGGFSLKEFVHMYVRPGTYNISVTCTNQGQITPVYVRPARITANPNPNLCVPAVTVRNSGLSRQEAPSYHRQDTLRLYAIAKSDCPKVHIDQVRWSVHHITAETPFPTRGSHKELSGVTVDKHEFSIPAFRLEYGLWAAKMQADAYIRSLGTVSSYEVGWFRIVPHPLVCVISGGDRLSMPKDDVRLDASHSYDPDNPDGKLRDVTVEWRCWRYPSGQNDSYCLGKMRKLAETGLKLKAISDKMELKRVYTFELRLRHAASNRTCRTQQLVDIAAVGASRAGIICLYNCQDGSDWQDKISYLAKCLNCPGEFDVLWRITTLSGTGGIINWLEDTSFAANYKHLIINAGVLEPASKYHLSVQVARKGAAPVTAGIAQMTMIRLKEVPTNGSCHSHPHEGVASVTSFRLHCKYWVTKSPPLSYLFMQERSDGKGYSVVYEDINPETDNVSLTIGNPKHNFQSSIRVRITDAFGMWAYTSFNITVKSPVPIAERPVIEATKKVFELLPSGFDEIDEAIKQGNTPKALQTIDATASLLNQITDPETTERIEDPDKKRKLRQKLLDAVDEVKPSSLGTLQQTADAISEVAGGHRDEYYPATVEKLINSTEKLSEILRDEYGKDKSMSPKVIEKAATSVLRALSSGLHASSEDVIPPSLKPVDLFYPNNERDYEVFDEERIAHMADKRQRVSRVAHKFMTTTNNVYQALGDHMEPGERSVTLKSDNIDMWLQKFDNETALNSTVAGLPPNAEITAKDTNYAMIPDMADIISQQSDDVKSVEVTVTTMKKNPYWWDEESAKNVTTDVVHINLRTIPGYKKIQVENVTNKVDIFLKRNTLELVHVTGRVVLLDWFETLNKRRNFPKDADIVQHKIINPPGGFSQIIQIIPSPQIALAHDRKRENITYEIPVKLFLSYRRDEKASIHLMKHSFRSKLARKRWSLPKHAHSLLGRPVDVFTIIHRPPPRSGVDIEEWYLSAMLHPETGKRLLNSTVLSPIAGHQEPPRRGNQTKLMGEIPIPVHSADEEAEMRLAMGLSVMKHRELHQRFIEDPDFVHLPQSDPNFPMRGGWLLPQEELGYVYSPTNISAIYTEDIIGSLERREICANTMNFHTCERHKSIAYNLTLFVARCIYWSEELSLFSDEGCEVGELSTVDVLHCRCDHLTPFAGSFLVLPNKIDVAHSVDANMLLQLNFSSAFLMAALLLMYVLLFMYARKQDLRDVRRRQIVYVDDNDPRHRYAYLVTVYTGVQYKSGTTAHVAMVLVGEDTESETHLLTGEKKRRRTLERGSDSWFLITTEKSLGDLTQLRIWHDNSGKNPEWFLDRVLVRDCQTDKVWIFLVGRWVHPVTGLLVTIRPAALHEIVAWNTSVSRRAEDSLRDGHLWFSIFSRPPNSSFTRCQRLASATTLLAANIVTSLAFYGIPTGDPADQISRSSSFGITAQDAIISIESALIVSVLVAPIVLMFRRSRSLEDVKKRTIVMETEEGEEPIGANSKAADRLAKDGEEKAISGEQAAAEAPTQNPVQESSLEGKTSNTARNEEQPGDEGRDRDARRATLAALHEKVEGGPVALQDVQEGYKLPWWFAYIAWVLSSLIIGFSVMLSISWSMSFGKVKCYIWLASSGISLLQSIIIIQPLLIVAASILCTYICGATPEVENRKSERPQQAFVDDKLAKQYAETIHAKRTLPMYHQIPAKKLRKLRAEKMKALLTRQAIKDIATFLVYIACLLLIIHSNKDPLSYYSTQTARNMFIEGNMVKGQNDCVQFSDATDMGSVYQYLNTTFVRTLHQVKDYNGNDDRRDGVTTQPSLFFIGVVRLRQVRITREPCHTADQFFWMNFTACKNHFTWQHEDKTDYGQNWAPDPSYHNDPWTNEATEAWLFKNASYLRALPYVGEYATYPGSGYCLHLGRSPKSSEVVLKYVADAYWFDAYTRALFVEFTMYNADSDLFNFVVLLFEQTPVGTVTPTHSIKTSKLFLRAETISKVDLYMTGFYVFFIIFNTVVEARRIRRAGLKLYFSDKWNVLDLTLVLMGYVCIGLYIYRYIVVEDAIMNLRNTDENKFANFYIPVFWDYILTYAQAFALLLTMAKFWKILTFNKRMVAFSLTLEYSKRDLRAFFFIFFIAIIAYAYWGTIMFGFGVAEFQDMWSALMSLILFSIGTFDVDTYVSAGRFFGILFFATYVFFVMIYLINVMLAIIMAGYELAMDDMEHLETKYDVIDVFIWEVKNFFEDSSSDSEEDEVVTARRMRRRRVRGFLRKVMPCCVSDTRKRNLRRPAEQEEMWQLQRFMSRTQASGIPQTIRQRDDSIGSQEDFDQQAAANRGRRQGMVEPEDEYDDEVVEDRGPTEGEPARQGPGHQFLLDEADVDHRQVSKGKHTKKRKRRGKRRRRLPPVPHRKSIQNDTRFLPSLTVAAEDMPKASSSSQPRSKTSYQQKRSSAATGAAATSWKRSEGAQRYSSTQQGAGRFSMHSNSGRGISGTRTSGTGGQGSAANKTLPRDQQRNAGAGRPDPLRSRVHAIDDIHSYVEVDVERHASQINNVVT